jgi:uncharacterized membrane protein
MRCRQICLSCTAAVLTMVLAGVSPCFANLTFCNKSGAHMTVAIGYLKGDDGWVSQGWWSLGAGECKAAWQGLPPRTFYAFAVNDKGVSWPRPGRSGRWFCTSSDKFLLRNRDYADGNNVDCDKGTNLKTKLFVLIDTGQFTNYTHTFTPPKEAGGPPSPSPPAPQPAPSPAPPSGKGKGTACQRFPNLCAEPG